MSEIPVPDLGKGPPLGGPSSSTQAIRPVSITASSDPIEGQEDKNQLAMDNKKLEILSFEAIAKRRAFYFVLIASATLFVGGTAMFCEVSRRMFGWQTILVLLAFFTPATVILTVLIRAIFSLAAEKKDDSKKDDAGDLIPASSAAKLIAELYKAVK